MNWQNTHCIAFWKKVEIALQKLVVWGGGRGAGGGGAPRLRDCSFPEIDKIT